MIKVTLPDGSIKEMEDGASPRDVAESISKSLSKRSIVATVNGEPWDMERTLEGDSTLALHTKDDPEGLEVIRHDAAHILAQAVQKLFPGTQVTIGPVIDDGFYYDFAREEPFSTDDFDAIEKEMNKIIDANYPIIREEWDRNEAIAKFKEIGETYKAQIIEDLPESETITVYKHGDEWYDLCRGPHLPSTGKLPKAFKLMKLAGAYWRGDSNNEMLQRIYGTAWTSEKELKAYLHRLEEAEKRDHRKLGNELDLFHLQKEAQGSVFWHPRGFMIWRQLEAYIRRRQDEFGYQEVKTPQLLDSVFWEQSGHWSKFRENMFVVPDEAPSTDDEGPVVSNDADLMALKPMNCPAHIQIFKQGTKSYRDLPIRMSEFGCCHRNEAHGALHGIMRVRQMTQDDAHIFCREDQVTDEVVKFLDLFNKVYTDFGLTDIDYKLATRPEQRGGSDEVWDQAEKSLADALTQAGLEFEIAEGEGAFYGPKLEFHLTDAIGRTWQCGTLQLDYVLPDRLDASYIGEDNERHRPVMLHRAVFGTFERFMGILIEHYAGAFPMWLAPTQMVLATITPKADEYAIKAAEKLKAAGIRVELDLRHEKINYKVREHSHQKVPVIAVIGMQEAEEEKLALRRFGTGNSRPEIVTLVEACETLGVEAKAPDLR
ncbi:threonine--tRNA ligase [Hirschia maritima]|uniref:threonine--tRNA ligase n=1 Tax=Hirschia maritima TaxID=1121961 RepID=UPI0003673027|nr:threonine--tRNA ligase [Hirschia maritima]